MSDERQRGVSLVEMLVGLTFLLLMMAGLFSVVVHNSRIGKSQRLISTTQANARSCLFTVVQRLRSAGWDPINAGIPTVALDPDLADDISQIEVYADLDADGATNGPLEQILIRHDGDRVEWRPTGAGGFEIVALNISNDADGDGTPEPMFVPDSAPDPTRITVRVTAVSPIPDPMTADFVRFTAESDVVLRKSL